MAAGETLPALAERHARERPEDVAVIFENESLTYRALDTDSQAVAAYLSALDIGRGDRVAIMALNHRHFLSTWFGVMRIGAIEVPLNTAARGRRLERLLDASRSKAIFIDEDLVERIQDIQLPASVRAIVTIPGPDSIVRHTSASIVPLTSILDRNEERQISPLDPSDPAALFYTSGTSGPSKGVLCPHGHLRALAVDTIDLLGLTSADVIYDPHPFFHAHAQGQAVFAAMILGTPLVTRKQFSVSQFLPDVRANAATFAFLVGAAGLLLNQPESPDDDKHSLRLLCAIPIPRGREKELVARYNTQLVEIYGSTEMGVIACGFLETGSERVLLQHSVRRAIRIVDDLEQPTPVGAPGEILVRAQDSWSMFLEYVDMPDATLASWRNLWFHTGDLGYLDSDDFLHFVGRKKDSIRRRGENVSAFEVEQTLNRHPQVADSAVMPWPSPVGEEDVWAVIVPAAGVKPSAEDLLAYCELELESFAVPRYIQFADDVPRTPTLRIEKYKLIEAGLSPDAFDRERPDDRRVS